MTILRGVMLVVGVAIVAPAARAQTPEPVNSAYEQLPTAWDQPPEALPVEPLPPVEYKPTPTAYPPSAQPWSATTAPAVMPAAAYADPRGIACGDGCYCADVNIGAYPPFSFWFAAAELTVLNPHYDNGLFTLNDPRSSVAPRLIFGWESPRGLGLRTRFWWLNDHQQILADPQLPPDLEVKLQARRFDFEVYRRFSFDGSSLAVGAGVTNAAFRWQLAPDLRPQDSGTGVEFFAEGRHLLWATPGSESAVVARGRFASLVGQWRDDSGFGFRNGGDSNIEILEAAFGWEDKLKFDHCDLLLQTLIEAQTWDATYNGDLGLFGLTLSAGLRW
jgi:hypothetical protein